MSENNQELILPPWAVGVTSDYLEPGAQLRTVNGLKIGNAVTVSVFDEYGKTFAHVVTDIGTKVTFTENELKELFHPPEWKVDISKHLHNEIETSAGEYLADAILDESIGRIRINGMPFSIVWYSSELLPNLNLSEEELNNRSDSLDLEDVALSLRYEEDHQLWEVDYTALQIKNAENANGCWKIGEDDGIEITSERQFNIPGAEREEKVASSSRKPN